MSQIPPDPSDEALARRLASELPRYPAPARMRSAILAAMAPTAASTRPWWLAPALSAAATALALTLFFIPLLPRLVPVDPVEHLTRAVVAEHMRAVMWGARRPDVIPTALPWLTQETGIGLTSVFPGDERLTLLEAEPIYLEQRRGLAVHYRDADGHRVTYIVLPAPGLTMPERRREKIDRWRPALLHDSGYSVWMWKQRDLAVFIVSDMVSQADHERFRDYFVRLRTATEPVAAY
jgi:hypothetical protein